MADHDHRSLSIQGNRNPYDYPRCARVSCGARRTLARCNPTYAGTWSLPTMQISQQFRCNQSFPTGILFQTAIQTYQSSDVPSKIYSKNVKRLQLKKYARLKITKSSRSQDNISLALDCIAQATSSHWSWLTCFFAKLAKCSAFSSCWGVTQLPTTLRILFITVCIKLRSPSLTWFFAGNLEVD